jgi:hypothetical protein
LDGDEVTSEPDPAAPARASSLPGAATRREFEGGTTRLRPSHDAVPDDDDEEVTSSQPMSVRTLPNDSVRARPHSALRDVPTLMESRPSLEPDATAEPPPAAGGEPPRRSRPSPIELVRNAYRVRPASVVFGTAVLSFVIGSALVGSLVYAMLRPPAVASVAASAASSAALTVRPEGSAPPAAPTSAAAAGASAAVPIEGRK